MCERDSSVMGEKKKACCTVKERETGDYSHDECSLVKDAKLFFFILFQMFPILFVVVEN